MSAPAQSLLTEDAFLALPVSNNKVELLDGEVVVSPSPNWWHQEVARRLVVALSEWAQNTQGPWTVVVAPSDVRFAPGRILQPDIYVVDQRIPRDHQGPMDLVPVLCIEVLSNDRVYDRVTKRLIYGQAGVVEHWVVDPAGSRIEQWTGPDLANSDLAAQRLESGVLSGFQLDIAALFA